MECKGTPLMPSEASTYPFVAKAIGVLVVDVDPLQL